MKTVFITGGSTGIGAASVAKFIKEGWNVGFMDINAPAAEELQKRINEPDRLLFNEAIPPIIQSGGGTVVINASDQWFVGKPNSFAYGMTKGALGQITRSLSIDLGPKNIRVNAVCAGTIHTPLVDNLFQQFADVNRCTIEDYWTEENKLYARGSAGTPEEVAEVIYFLASDASSFCTGGHYLVDGGLVAR